MQSGKNSRPHRNLLYSEYGRDSKSFGITFSAWDGFWNNLHILKIIGFFSISRFQFICSFLCASRHEKVPSLRSVRMISIQAFLMQIFKELIFLSKYSPNKYVVQKCVTAAKEIEFATRLCVLSQQRIARKTGWEIFKLYGNDYAYNMCRSHCFGLVFFTFVEYSQSLKTLGSNQHILIATGPAQNIRRTQEVIMNKKAHTNTHSVVCCVGNLLWAMHTCGKFHIDGKLCEWGHRPHSPNKCMFWHIKMLILRTACLFTHSHTYNISHFIVLRLS